MKSFSPKSINLRALILIFVLLATLATLGNSLFVAYQVQREALIDSTLEANRAYASKVASSIGEFLRSAQSQLHYSSQKLSDRLADGDYLRTEADRLEAQGIDFNAIAIVDASGTILQAYPEVTQIASVTGQSKEIQTAVAARRPLISPAYTTLAGELVVLISQPIFGTSGEYLGIVGGVVFLRRQSALHTLIGSHYHHDGTYAYVTDEHQRLLYHPEAARIGERLDHDATVEAALEGGSGTLEVVNSRGIPMLAGYAEETTSHWAVVAQQPRAQALATLGRLMRDMLIGIVPASIVGLLAIIAVTQLIVRPLHQLAQSATQLSAPETTERLRRIRAWYSEASAIRQAMLVGVQLLQQKLGRLSQEAQSDPLTGLANRRAMNAQLELLTQTGREYAVLALDIDHFKSVNDRFGHDAGDEALRQVAAILDQCSRGEDLACRAGGEEFVLLLPDTPLETARTIAERIREMVAAAVIPTVGSLTISIGAACRSDDGMTPEAVLKQADEQLYRAKEGGRNRVVALTDPA